MITSPPEPRIIAAAHVLAVDVVTAEVVQALESEGIRAILLKGPALARWLYRDGEGRSYSDTDLLVNPDDWDRAQDVLRRLRFAPRVTAAVRGDRGHASKSWRRRDTGSSVDLHISLTELTVPPSSVWRVLSSGTETLVVSGKRVEAMGLPQRAFHVALHAAQHGRHPKPLEDLRRALEQVPTRIWTEARDVAEDLDAVGAFATGLRMVPEGERLAAELDLPTTRSIEVALRAANPPPTAMGFEWLFSRPGLRTKLALGIRKAFPPVEVLRSQVPLARRRPFGPVAAYLWRPIWLLWYAPRGFLAWRRARKDTT